jgi:hypothetical protein
VGNPLGNIDSRCCKEFVSKYASLDDWMAYYPSPAASLSPPMIRNVEWCSKYIKERKQDALDRFRWHITHNTDKDGVYCPNFICPTRKTEALCRSTLNLFKEGDQCLFGPAVELDKRCPSNSSPKRLCPTVADFDFCELHIKQIDGPNGACHFTKAAANEGLSKIQQQFAAAKSQIPCTAAPSKGVDQRADFTCTRPRQQISCGGSKLVRCLLVEDPKYIKLKNDLKATVKTLNELYSQKGSGSGKEKSGSQATSSLPSGHFSVRNDVDPLLAGVGSQSLCKEMKQKNASFNWSMPPSRKPGFQFSCDTVCKSNFVPLNEDVGSGVDGLSTPLLQYLPSLTCNDKTDGMTDNMQKDLSAGSIIKAGQSSVESAVKGKGPGPVELSSEIENKIINDGLKNNIEEQGGESKVKADKVHATPSKTKTVTQ